MPITFAPEAAASLIHLLAVQLQAVFQFNYFHVE